MFQSHWMAKNKIVQAFPAACHSLSYGIPFVLLGSLTAVIVIVLSHYIIDRYRLAKYFCFAKNFLAPHKTWTYWEDCDHSTGYPRWIPDWLGVWLMIVADNTLHLTINYFALKYL